MSQDPAPPPYWLGALLVGGGAAVGALTRYGLAHAIGIEPLATTTINILGCAVFGFVSIATKHKPRLALFSGTGFCGGFTTFSTFSLLAMSTVRADSVWLAAAIVVIHLIMCPLAYFLGTFGALRSLRRSEDSQTPAGLASSATSEVAQ